MLDTKIRPVERYDHLLVPPSDVEQEGGPPPLYALDVFGWADFSHIAYLSLP